jgi:2-C-methyl-D-erythritol 4-phosphate cytidylyltransferase / 2-C-methyl-D-erythritol 2,4-cyclodiphosphate synthase
MLPGMEAPDAVVILLGAGAGRRLGGTEPKAFRPIGGRPILAVAAAGAGACPHVTSLVVAVPQGREATAAEALNGVDLPVSIVTGGPSREDSVRAAIARLPSDVSLVVVHDAARPFTSPELFARVLAAVWEGGDAATPVLPVTDTVIRVRGGILAGVEPREELSLTQTPQAFRADALREAHAKAEVAGLAFTDDATLLRWAGFEVRTVPGEPANTKITTLADLAEADRRIGGARA